MAYLDGKVFIDPTPLQLVSNITMLSGTAPLTVLRHPLIDPQRYVHGWREEFVKERGGIPCNERPVPYIAGY